MLTFQRFRIFRRKLFFYLIMFVLLLLLFETILFIGGFFYFCIYSSLYSSKIEENAFRILFLGESTTKGGTLGRENAYPAQVEKILQQKYLDKKIKSYNKGISAIETTAILRNLDRNMVSYKPYLVILMAGHNDNFVLDNETLALKSLYSWSRLYRLKVFIEDLSLIEFRGLKDGDFRYVGGHGGYQYKPLNSLSQVTSNMNLIIQKVQDYNSKIWLAGYLQPDAREKVNPVLKKIAEKNKIIYIRDYPEVDFEVNRSLFMDDGWHPNVEGHRIIAEKIAEKIIREGVIDSWQPEN